MNPSYCRRCGSKLPEGARFCPSCGISLTSETKPSKIHQILKTKGKPKVVVENFSPGSIEVEHGTEGQVTVDLDLRTSEDLDWNVSQEGDLIRITCRMKSSWSWPSYIFAPRPKADILISVPKETDLELENRAGHVAILGVKGTLSARSSAGTLSVQDCEGTIKTRTKAGSINLKNLNGAVTARSSAGSITFNGTLSETENWFRSSLGSIDITIDARTGLTVEASTNLGTIRCIPELEDVRYERGRQIGRIGAGKGKLIVETNLGSITIRS
jgi:hypothetical protein